MKAIGDDRFRAILADYIKLPGLEDRIESQPIDKIKESIEQYKKEMLKKAKNYEFEEAALLLLTRGILSKIIRRRWSPDKIARHKKLEWRPN